LYRECALRQPNLQWPHVALAAAYALSGQLEEARAEAAEVLRINPGFTIQSYKRIVVFKDPKDTEHRLDGLRKAWLPESCPIGRGVSRCDTPSPFSAVPMTRLSGRNLRARLSAATRVLIGWKRPLC